ncbi:uncharacterized protein [Palaemon carinicauda]|uniref:uncharacterized protein n=1 Tax=Palaemon carinicauda TaxID=392227 RepID=UPI0035B5FE5A
MKLKPVGGWIQDYWPKTTLAILRQLVLKDVCKVMCTLGLANWGVCIITATCKMKTEVYCNVRVSQGGHQPPISDISSLHSPVSSSRGTRLWSKLSSRSETGSGLR